MGATLRVLEMNQAIHDALSNLVGPLLLLPSLVLLGTPLQTLPVLILDVTQPDGFSTRHELRCPFKLLQRLARSPVITCLLYLLKVVRGRHCFAVFYRHFHVRVEFCLLE